jgi:hypothetical protein
MLTPLAELSSCLMSSSLAMHFPDIVFQPFSFHLGSQSVITAKTTSHAAVLAELNYGVCVCVISTNKPLMTNMLSVLISRLLNFCFFAISSARQQAYRTSYDN